MRVLLESRIEATTKPLAAHLALLLQQLLQCDYAQMRFLSKESFERTCCRHSDKFKPKDIAMVKMIIEFIY